MEENTFLKHFEIKIEVDEDKKKEDKKEKVDCVPRTRDDVHRDIRYKMPVFGKIPINLVSVSAKTLTRIATFAADKLVY